MLATVLRRLAQALGVLLVVAALAFVMSRQVGDPVALIVGQDATPESVARVRAELGLDQPLPQQFASFLWRAVHGDFGMSLRQGRPVAALIARHLPATLELAGLAALMAVLLGVPLGVHAALRRGRRDAQWLMALSLLGVSLPTFLIGLGLILVFAVGLGWLPSFGRGATVAVGGWETGLLSVDGWRHLLLPAATLAVYQVALLMRLVRAELLQVLRSDFIRFARARGLAPRALHFGHALRNTLVPVVTVAGLQLGQLIAFSVVTETVFQWPGLGLMFIQAVGHADLPVMSAYLCLVALVFVLINLAVDLLYLWIDPRLRTVARA